jgi:hypothetical protein
MRKDGLEGDTAHKQERRDGVHDGLSHSSEVEEAAGRIE